MIPIGDVNPRRHFPVVTVAIIVLNILVFLYQFSLPQEEAEQLIMKGGMIPSEVSDGLDLAATTSLLTSMFMHGSWLHVLGNMLYLWIFGDNIEEVMGVGGFSLFYLVAGLAAAFAQIVVYPASNTPTIGASGAVAGVLGAYLALFPHARVRTLIFVFRFIRLVELPATMVLGFWFVLQIFNGLVSLGMMSTGGVAWFAHIGGFATGLLVGWRLRQKRPRQPPPPTRYRRTFY
ncbi:MAG: rhomboid family intramembrane serine protease [Chloroflexota bacterium]|nr:rhomboid family intramembrane serine protease [Chloroflexota bacterium]